MSDITNKEIAAMLHPFFVKQGVVSCTWNMWGNYFERLEHVNAGGACIGYSYACDDLVGGWEHCNVRGKKIGSTYQKAVGNFTSDMWHHYDRSGHEICGSEKKADEQRWAHYDTRLGREIGGSEESSGRWTHKLDPHKPEYSASPCVALKEYRPGD